MKVAITDANIFIDLYELGLTGYLFRLDVAIHTTESVLYELADELEVVEQYRLSGVLMVYNLHQQDYGNALDLDVPKGLSNTDRTVIWIAEELEDCIVLTGDDKLRKEVQSRHKEVHGILWLFDQWVEEYQLIPPETAIHSLQDLMQINDRLPMADIQKRIEKWREQKSNQE